MFSVADICFKEGLCTQPNKPNPYVKKALEILHAYGSLMSSWPYPLRRGFTFFNPSSSLPTLWNQLVDASVNTSWEIRYNEFALIQIASSQIDIGDFEGAKATLAKAEKEKDDSSIYTPVIIAQLYNRANHSLRLEVPPPQTNYENKQKSTESIQGIVSPFLNITALINDADAQIEKKQYREAQSTLRKAEAIAEQVESQHDRSLLLKNIGLKLVDAGSTFSAERIIEKIPCQIHKDFILSKLAAARAKAGYTEKAWETADKISCIECKDRALEKIALAQTSIGKHLEAKETATKAAALAQAKPNAFEDAIRSTGEINNKPLQSWTLKEVIQAEALSLLIQAALEEQ
ncbi:MAG: hypothetical protein S4CHLAM45_08660 [Chlamydiales bacterium]|nr:hypothetical protein [Chlamydiales bacterium]MCH9620384.1 hypothetical protein [Chlamydiales bacterium]MCH9622970.1 hypothetical protein [Chlamydiales bacterium]